MCIKLHVKTMARVGGTRISHNDMLNYDSVPLNKSLLYNSDCEACASTTQRL